MTARIAWRKRGCSCTPIDRRSSPASLRLLNPRLPTPLRGRNGSRGGGQRLLRAARSDKRRVHVEEGKRGARMTKGTPRTRPAAAKKGDELSGEVAVRAHIDQTGLTVAGK